MDTPKPNSADVRAAVRRALNEDLGDGDISSQLITAHLRATATVKCRQSAVLCGTAWFEEAFRALDPDMRIEWYLTDGETIAQNQIICSISGNARAMLSAERTAINFLQTLSATATITRKYVQKVTGTGCRILDTRKTLPGLRNAQKYAVLTGGGNNHRHGLYDGILLKENHQFTDPLALRRLKRQLAAEGLLVEVEIERLEQLEDAIASQASRVMLDNFSLSDIREAVLRTAGRVQLEASGNYRLDNIAEVARTGVDFISVGALTKNINAIDFSMRIQAGN